MALPTPTLTAVARSASGRITLADLPPSSSATRAIRSAASRMIRAPVAVEPVKETRSTSGCPASASPTTGAGAGHQVEHARRQAGLGDRVEEQVRGQRGQLAGLEHHRAAGGERGRQLRHHLVQRVVPRGDRADHADRLADDEGVADRLLDRRAGGERDVVAQHGQRQSDLHPGGELERRAQLDGDGAGEVVGAGGERGVQPVEVRRTARPGRWPTQPGKAARAAATARSTSAGGAGRHLPDQLAGARVLHVDQVGAGGRRPLRRRGAGGAGGAGRRTAATAGRRGPCRPFGGWSMGDGDGVAMGVATLGRAMKLALGVWTLPVGPPDSTVPTVRAYSAAGRTAGRRGPARRRPRPRSADARRAGAPGAGAGSARRTAPGPRRNRGRTSRAPTRPRSSAAAAPMWVARAGGQPAPTSPP